MSGDPGNRGTAGRERTGHAGGVDATVHTDGGRDAERLRGPPDERTLAGLLTFGVVNLDKPPGPSAHQVAAWVRDMVDDALTAAGHAGIDRVAHAGTLDPKVTGSLPLVLGDATRLAQVFDDAEKEYVAVLELHGRAPADFESVLAEFEGAIYQKPPKKSAVRREVRVREIHDLEVHSLQDRRALLRIRCESGTYVRKLCHDLGLALGTGAHMGDLRRTATGSFDDTDLVTLQDLADALAAFVAREGEHGDDGEPDAGGPEPDDLADVADEWLRAAVDPAERTLVDLPAVTIAESAAVEVATGAPVYAPGVLDVPTDLDPGDEPQVACYTPDGAAVCLGRLVGDPDADSGVVVDLDRVLV